MIDVDYLRWPTVLCGPMLRRVEPGLVGVFVALRFRRRVTVTVFACAPDGTPGASVGSATAVTRRLGRRLHVTLVAVTGLQLSPGQLYAYDMRLDVEAPVDAEDSGTSAAGLAALGLLAGDAALGYIPGLLPTFRAPAEAANALEFIHASCRKMHGPGKDAMPHLDEVLKGLRTDEFKRPQMLFLTGDQIYADDVACPLLPVLTAVGHALLGWSEVETLEYPTGDVALDECLPGLRKYVAIAARLSSDAADCHLLGLGEFYAMYLMAWCDAVWPEALPDPVRLYPPSVVTGGAASAVLAPLDIPVTLVATAKGYLGDGSVWQTQANALLQVKAGLPAVRRALANVPTYMMMDDHEVTDDWNINRQWQLDVYGNAIGRRLVSNALFAFGAFQAWGNDPNGMFASGAAGAKLLEALEAIGQLDGSTYNESTPAVTAAQSLVRVGTQSFASGVNWDFSIERSGYRVLVLDTRTHRDDTRDGQAALMTPAEMQRQITAAAPTSKDAHIVLSPAPVIGHPFVERIVQATAGRHGFDAAVDLESWWSEQRPGPFEDLMDRFSALGRVVVLSGDVHYGFTATVRYWNDRPNKVTTACITQLVSSSLKNESDTTNFLGGARSQLQHAKLTAGETAVDIGELIALTSPLLLISVGPTLIDDLVKRPPLEEMLVPPAREDTLGWTSGPVTITRGDGSTKPEVGQPAVHRVATTPETATKPPDWKYRVGFSCDLKHDRGVAVPVPSARPPNETFIARNLRLALDWRMAKGHDGDRLIVGSNNFARVSLIGEPPHLAVQQEFWFRPDGQAMRPYTSHFVDMDPPIKTEVAPLDPTPAPAGLPNLSTWSEQMSSRPALALQDKVIQLNQATPGQWNFHRLESGWGPINLDFYAVRIDMMPRHLPGDPAGTDRPVGRAEFMQYLRRNLVVHDVIVNSLFSEFFPYAAADGVAWAGSPADALGALIHIAIPGISGVPGNSGTVMATASDDEGWMFSTLKTPLDGDHPVSGNRRFGIYLSDDGRTHYLFTMGTDRCTDRLIAQFPGAVEVVWLGADLLWKSFQARAVALVQSLGGIASVMPPFSKRYDWPLVMSAYYHPSSAWKS